MPRANANGIELEYETFGSEGDPPLLLVMGLGAQMIAWDAEFCEQLAGRGFRVIRYDNRDTGLSTRFDDLDVDLMDAMTKAFSGQPVEAPYLLSDMAADGIGLLDALGIDKAHIVGASMGGMIVQTMAIEHPDRILTVTSIMSTTGNQEVGQPTPEAMAALTNRPPADREGYLAQSVETSRLLNGGVKPFDEERARASAAAAYDRAFYPPGFGRQLVAIMASGDRTPKLCDVKAPMLVIHGDADPLVTYSGGQATAAACPGAELVTIEGMGHSLPTWAWGEVIDAIAKHTGKVAA